MGPSVSGHEDEVRRVLPADDDRVTRADAHDRRGAGRVLAPDDHLAGDVGGDPVLRLVAEVRALVDPPLQARLAVRRRRGMAGRLHPEALGPHGHDDARAGRGPGIRVRDEAREPEATVRLDDAAACRWVVLHELAVDRVGDADEVGHEAVHRTLVQVRRAALLLDPAVVHDDDRVAHRQRLLLVVGHVHERDPDLLLQRLELQLHLLAQLEVEGAQRLVEEQHGGVVDQRPGERDALLLAAGELPGAAALVPAQADELQRFAHPSGLVRLGRPSLAQAVADVLGHVHVREQGVVLEHRVDVAVVGRHAGHRLAREVDLARGGLLEARDHAQRGGLAAARGAEERVERAAGHRQAHGIDGGDVAEPLGDVHDVDVRRLPAPPRRGDGPSRRGRIGRRRQAQIARPSTRGDRRCASPSRPVRGWYEAPRQASTRIPRSGAKFARSSGRGSEIRAAGEGRHRIRGAPPAARAS